MRIERVRQMEIEQFIGKLLPTFGRDRVIEDIRITRGELEELASVYSEAANLMRNTASFKNKEVLDKLATFKRIVGTGNDNMIVYISKNLKQVIDNLNMAERLVEASLNSTIASKGLTFKQATVIQYVDAIHFTNKYARKLLHYVYVMESAQYAEDQVEAMKALSKPDMAFIAEKFVDFCNAFKSVSGDTEESFKKIEEVPEAEVNTATVRTMTATVGPTKLDPLKMGFIGTWMNPIYFIRMMVAEWQVKRYNEAKEELVVLRLRRMQLEQQRNGKANAKLEKEIEYTESRIQKLSYEVQQTENKYA